MKYALILLSLGLAACHSPAPGLSAETLRQQADSLALAGDAGGALRYLEAAADVVGAENVSDAHEPVTGSEDFADMLKVVPGAYIIIGHEGTVPVHNPGFVLDPKVLPVGASVMARVLERRLPVAAG